MHESSPDKRLRMVSRQIRDRGIRDSRVLDALKKVPRHLFVPEPIRGNAYDDEPLPIGEGQTISQPYIVGFMTESLELRGGERVLEIGTGSGYQTAVVAEIAREVDTIELVESLAVRARALLGRLGYRNIRFRVGDGHLGWEKRAPYDAILVTAAPPRVPEALKNQLKLKGRLVIPVGEGFQDLVLIRRKPDGFSTKRLLPVRFVPLVRSPGISDSEGFEPEPGS